MIEYNNHAVDQLFNHHGDKTGDENMQTILTTPSTFTQNHQEIFDHQLYCQLRGDLTQHVVERVGTAILDVLVLLVTINASISLYKVFL